MNEHPCVLTIGDFSTLKTLHEEWKGRSYELTAPLRRKLEAAEVVFPDDLPRDVATLGSEIAYAIGEDETQIHKLTSLSGLDRAWLPINLPVGLGLLGQREGMTLSIEIEPGRSRRVTLHRVLQQPESSWPGRFTPDKPSVATPLLRLVQGSTNGQTPRADCAHADEDDPGPAAG